MEANKILEIAQAAKDAAKSYPNENSRMETVQDVTNLSIGTLYLMCAKLAEICADQKNEINILKAYVIKHVDIK